ncbi:unnamed protein product, partial [Mesocestoides corti]
MFFLLKSTSVFQRGYSSAPKDIPPGSGDHPASNDGVPQHPYALSTQNIPENYPCVPVIAVTGYPLFPKFVKVIEITDQNLMELLRRKVKLGLPFAGVFLKKNPTDTSDVVKSIDDLYHVGTFVQIPEFDDLGHKIRMLAIGHRRIQLVKQVQDAFNDANTEALSPDEKSRNKRNGLLRRVRKAAQMAGLPADDATEAPKIDESTEETSSDTPASETTPEPSTSLNMEESPASGVLMVETVNVYTEPFENTPEIKALSAEIVKTIRDIITINPLYRESILAMLHASQRVVDEPEHLSDL